MAVAGTASQFAITASPVSAAMATLVGLLDPVGFDIGDILIVIAPGQHRRAARRLLRPDAGRQGSRRRSGIPAASRGGRDPAGRPSVLENEELPPEAKRSTIIFLAGHCRHRLLAMVEKLRPAFPDETGELVPMSTSIVIQIVMGVTATVIVLTCGVKIKTS